ncbi:hypothetical protein EX30DRAFT_338083 [Ascodesmis nigricans]|uniref:CFEM domain-containing protein n=1 Tax=Ascodesmis nigricans TaxID=341454 RepID=A0A4S2N2Q2_9PEZI|nr:hypothetical protein EX30DRAFT_338083 [Ascodesmis nigricans]
MKTYTALATLALAVAGAQAQLPNLPGCALTCLVGLVPGSGCGVDFACLCGNDQFVVDAAACIRKDCPESDIDASFTELQAVCEKAGVPIEIPGGGEPTSSAPVEPPASSAAPSVEPPASTPATPPASSSAVAPPASSSAAAPPASSSAAASSVQPPASSTAPKPPVQSCTAPEDDESDDECADDEEECECDAPASSKPPTKPSATAAPSTSAPPQFEGAGVKVGATAGLMAVGLAVAMAF